nr:MAG TPA: hypothetical protein [Caudoviricetes sp.]
MTINQFDFLLLFNFIVVLFTQNHHLAGGGFNFFEIRG